MEEERLSRALGRRGEKKQTKSPVLTQEVAYRSIASPKVVQDIAHDASLASTESPSSAPGMELDNPIAQDNPNPDHSAYNLRTTVDTSKEASNTKVVAADGESDILVKLNEIDAIIVTIAQGDSQPVHTYVHENNQQVYKDIQQPVHYANDESLYVRQHVGDLEQHNEEQIQHTCGQTRNEDSFAITDVKEVSELSTNIIESGNTAKFQAMVGSASKILKADKPFNGDDSLAILEAIGKVIIDIIPNISNKRLADDVYQSAKQLIRGSISLKQAYENWEDCDEAITQVLSCLGVLYINVVAAL